MKVAVPLSGRAAYFYHLFSIVLLYLYDAITHGGRFWASSQDGTELLYIINHNKGRWKPLICPPSTFPRNVACLLCFIRCGNCPDTLHLCPTCGFGWICLLNGKKKRKEKKGETTASIRFIYSTCRMLRMFAESEDRTPSATRRFVSYLLGAMTVFCWACRLGLCTAIMFGSSFRTSCSLSYPV